MSEHHNNVRTQYVDRQVRECQGPHGLFVRIGFSISIINHLPPPSDLSTQNKNQFKKPRVTLHEHFEITSIPNIRLLNKNNHNNNLVTHYKHTNNTHKNHCLFNHLKYKYINTTNYEEQSTKHKT